MSKIQETIQAIIQNLNVLIPVYSAYPADAFANGNVAVCIIDEEGNMYGKIWGTDKARGRQFARMAWLKATQVWLTGYKTGEFEKKIFNGELNEADFGIQAPDFVGWEGGQPVTLRNGQKLYVGFSGFRGFNDIEIVRKAVEKL